MIRDLEKHISNPGVKKAHWFRIYNPENPVQPGRSNRYVGNAFLLVSFSMQQLKKEKM
jgi:hypothetical protein